MTDLNDWTGALSAFAASCDAAARTQEASRIRAARAVLSTAPAASSFCPELLPSRERLEAMIATGAGESAALALMTPGTGVLLSKAGDGAAMASVALPGQGSDVSAVGETLALALLGALARALLIESSDGSGFVRQLDNGPRRVLN